MPKLKAFKGLRPPKELVEKIQCQPYDVIDSKEARLDAKDNYTVNVTYFENEVYHSSVNSTVFNVTKANMTATVVAQNVTDEQNPTFLIDDVTSDFKGNVTIVIDDHVYYNGTVKSPVAVIRPVSQL